MESTTSLKIERVPLEDLHTDPANARTHGDENLLAIEGSLRRFGQAEPLVVHAETGEGSGTAAVRQLLHLRGGELSFEAAHDGSSEPRERSVTVPTAQLLMDAAVADDHAARDAELPLPASARPKFAPVREGESTPRFDTVQWRVLSAIDGETTVEELSSRLGLTLPRVAAVVADLVRNRALVLS